MARANGYGGSCLEKSPCPIRPAADLGLSQEPRDGLKKRCDKYPKDLHYSPCREEAWSLKILEEGDFLAHLQVSRCVLAKRCSEALAILLAHPFKTTPEDPSGSTVNQSISQLNLGGRGSAASMSWWSFFHVTRPSNGCFTPECGSKRCVLTSDSTTRPDTWAGSDAASLHPPPPLGDDHYKEKTLSL